MFYHDHAWGTTRLNVYAGEAAGYLISDDTEKALVDNGLIPGAADTIPLIVQDKTFVPEDATSTTDGRRRKRHQLRPGSDLGLKPIGAALAASGITTSTCRRKTPATPPA